MPFHRIGLPLGLYPPIYLKSLKQQDNLVKGEPYLFVYETYTPSQNYYTSPHYSAAIKAIQAECQHVSYDLKNVINSFTPAGALILPDVETDAERQAVIQNVQNLFQGAENSNNLLISFRRNVEEKGVEFLPFTYNSTNVNLYDAANERTISRILAGHQIPSRTLVGLPDVRR